jgi:hypothetical protein
MAGKAEGRRLGRVSWDDNLDVAADVESAGSTIGDAGY